MYNITISPAAVGRRVQALACSLLTAALLAVTLPAHGQYVPASTPDESAAGAGKVPYGVQNTGNADAVTNGTILRMMCWDGSSPSLAWDYAGKKGRVSLTNAAGPVEDPDVVINPEVGNTASSTQVVVAYLVAGRVYQDVWRYDANANTCTRLITRRVDVTVTGNPPCSNPNIDAQIDGRGAIVYEQSGQIKVRAFNASALNAQLGPFTFPLVPPSGTTFSQPDMAVYMNRTLGANPVASIVSLIFLADGPSGRTVNMQQVNYNNINSSTPLNGLGTTVYTGAGNTSAPRIAAPWEWGGFAPTDFQAVVADADFTAGALNIVGINGYVGGNSQQPLSSVSNPKITVINSSPAINILAAHEKPVVAYAGDLTLVAWTQTDINTFDQDVLARQLDFRGDVYSGAAGYSVVNKEQAGNQSLPSLSGRYTVGVTTNPPAGPGVAAFYTFYDEQQEDILYKSSYYGNISLRGTGNIATTGTSAPADMAATTRTAGVAAGELAAYPNPAHGEATLAFTLAAQEKATALDVQDLTGRRVASLPVASLGAGAHAVPLRPDQASTPAGLYLVRLSTTQGTRTFRLRLE